jgi:hypothetical protein
VGEDPEAECDGSDACNGAGICLCSDGVLSAAEVDIDCGGPDCAACPGTWSCFDNCASTNTCLCNYPCTNDTATCQMKNGTGCATLGAVSFFETGAVVVNVCSRAGTACPGGAGDGCATVRCECL